MSGGGGTLVPGVYAWGRGEHGELGLGEVVRSTHAPRRCCVEENVVSVHAGQFHSLARTETGDVVTWGGGGSAQLGHGEGADGLQPRVVSSLLNRKLISVAGGRSHTLAVAVTGDVFAWGRVAYGQLGHGDTSDQLEPRLVEAMRGVRVREVTCGECHSLVLTTNHRVFAWGRGTNGRLGMGDGKAQLFPRPVERLLGKKITQIAAGYFHSVAITDSGRVYSWGCGQHGQLGHGDKYDYASPTCVEFLQRERITQVACGGFHTLAISGDRDVWAWGCGEKGQCGYGRKGDYTLPILLEAFLGKGVKKVAAGRGHSAALTADGELYTWGSGLYGQLGHGDCTEQSEPKKVEFFAGSRVRDVSCGAWHTTALVAE